MTFNAEESASFSLPSSVSFWALMWYDRFDIDKVGWFFNGQRKSCTHKKKLEIGLINHDMYLMRKDFYVYDLKMNFNLHF